MSKNLFNSVKLKKPNGSVFDLSHNVKQSMKFGFLYPALFMDCVPGDKIKLGMSALQRAMPMIAPLMDRVDSYCHSFFVPYRLLWDNWENFITNTEVSGAVPAHPVFDIGSGNMVTKLHQYFGIPDPANAANLGTERVSAFAWAAYQFVCNEYYRDQNIIPSEYPYKLSDGVNAYSTFREFRKRAWPHDYFTSALPFAQKGDPVSVPVALNEDTAVFKNADPGVFPDSSWLDTNAENVSVPNSEATSIGIGQDNLFLQENSVFGSSQLTDLRRAYALQRWLERNAVAGTRYIEFIRAHWGVNSSDKRLQRPEYITGTKSPFQISEVLNTTGTTELPQGNMAGHGVSVTNGKYGNYFCEEHGCIISIMSIIPRASYMQGIPKHFLQYGSPWDYFTGEFEHIGEQEIETRELYAFGSPGDGDVTFGYTPRYAQYKYLQNRVAGDMMTTLKFWHLANDYDERPELNQTFIECTPRTDIFAAGGSADYFISDIYHEIKASRLMSFYSTPI